MSVDFSRALKVKSPTKGVVTFYGLTTAPSHYVGFRSQSATRYIPMIANGGSVLFARIGGTQYGAYGTTNFKFKLTYTHYKWSFFGRTLYTEKYTLNSITSGTAGGVSLATTVKVRILNSSGSDVATQTFTFNANTTVQGYDTEIYNNTSNSAYQGRKIRIAVTLNGITLSFDITNLSEGQDIVTTPTQIFQFAPWIN